MKFIDTEVHGAWLIEPEPAQDERGFFARTFCARTFAERDLETRFVQHSTSYSRRRGTLRGMHFQRPPHEEAKLVRCVRGAIFDVVLDLRPASATYLGWHGVRLDEEDGRALHVPEGCAHGFQTLVVDSDVLYLISSPYVPEASTGVRWDDAAFDIEWPEAAERTIGERDRLWPDYVPGGR